MQELNIILDLIRKADKPFYVYLLHKPNGVPFYVGKGAVRKEKDERIAFHERQAKRNEPYPTNPTFNRHKINTIRKIWDSGLQVLYSIDSWHDTEESALAREVDVVKIIGRRSNGTGTLTNLNEGGTGTTAISPELKQQISQSLKSYYREHPEALEAMSQRTKAFFEDPNIIEQWRKNAIDNNYGGYIKKWLKEHPEKRLEENKKHSEWLKQWYKDNPDKAKELAENRNKVLRTEEHRKNMAEKTTAYCRENPDADKIRRKKAHEKNLERSKIKQECWNLIRDKLITEGKIKPQTKDVSTTQMYLWRKKGLVADDLCPLGQNGSLGDWQQLLLDLRQKLNCSVIP